MANRPKVVDLEKKRKTRTGYVWDGERLKLAGNGREKGKEEQLKLLKRSANKKRLLMAVAFVIAVALLVRLL